MRNYGVNFMIFVSGISSIRKDIERKTIKAVPPFAHPGFLNFNQTPYALEYVQPEIAGDIETLTQRYWK